MGSLVVVDLWAKKPLMRSMCGADEKKKPIDLGSNNKSNVFGGGGTS